MRERKNKSKKERKEKNEFDSVNVRGPCGYSVETGLRC